MERIQELRLIAHSLANGGKPDLSKLTQEELKTVLGFVRQLQ